jgi:hypothetical protein
MGKFDDIVKNELVQTKVRLMVLIKENDQPKEGSDKLIEIYEGYGFERKDVEIDKKANEEHLIMEKQFIKERTIKERPIKERPIKERTIKERPIKDTSITESVGTSTKTKSVKKAKRTSQTVTKSRSKPRSRGGGGTRFRTKRRH